jgi:hypothetical protein
MLSLQYGYPPRFFQTSNQVVIVLGAVPKDAAAVVTAIGPVYGTNARLLAPYVIALPTALFHS